MTDLRAAVAAGALGSEESYRALLQSIVEVARAIFGARASSVFLHDEAADELVFEAVAGEGAEELIGRRFPSSTGVAGWVLVTRQPLVIEELQEDSRFAREAAESTGFVPKGLMAVPLLHDERALGVLQARPASGLCGSSSRCRRCRRRRSPRLRDSDRRGPPRRRRRPRDRHRPFLRPRRDPCGPRRPCPLRARDADPSPPRSSSFRNS